MKAVVGSILTLAVISPIFGLAANSSAAGSSVVAESTISKPTIIDAACELCLYGPDNMAFDDAGNVYLVDTDHKTRSRVLKISPQGKLLEEWHVFSVVPGKDNGPTGIAIDKVGNIYVTDAGSERVLKLSTSGKVLATLGETPGTFSGLDEGHVAVDQNGNIYVAEAGPNLIQKFAPTLMRVASWYRDKGAGPEQWNRPETIFTDANGNLVVTDWGNHRVEILSPSGKTIQIFDATKGVPLNRASIAGAAVDRNGHIFVADYQLYRIQEYDQGGNLLATIGNSAGTTLFEHAPSSIAVDRQGILYAADGLSVVKFSRDGKLLARWH